MAKMFNVFTIVEEEGQEKARWTQIGIGFENRDGSYNIKLDASPINGRLQMRLPNKKEGKE